MAYCPQCGAGYRDGAEECADCHIPLRPGVLEIGSELGRGSEPKLMRVRVFSGPTAVMNADLARNLLATEGILCVLPGEYTAEMLPGVEPVQVLVREGDAGRASELLEAYFDGI
ncbi:MAG: putative signal transducing protein [Terriglobia bacterium]